MKENSPWKENRSQHWKHLQRHPQNREASQGEVRGLLCCNGVDSKWAVCSGTTLNRFRDLCKSQASLFSVVLTDASWDKVRNRVLGPSQPDPVTIPLFSYVYVLFHLSLRTNPAQEYFL